MSIAGRSVPYHRVAPVLALALLACRRPPGPTGDSARAGGLRAGVVRFTPRAEDDRVGPVGVGLARCELYVYAWARNGQCRYQLNHCSLAREGAEQVVCLSLADEHSLACGERTSACGQTVECVCPVGAPDPVAEAPGTEHLSPTDLGRTLTSPDTRCTARVATLPGGAAGPPPAPCIFAVRECEGDAACQERTVMLSCGVRSSVCERPVQCVCPDAGTAGSPRPAP